MLKVSEKAQGRTVQRSKPCGRLFEILQLLLLCLHTPRLLAASTTAAWRCAEMHKGLHAKDLTAATFS
jgi:hypothetical protein